MSSLLPGLTLVALAVVLILSNGGYASASWYPAALFVLALGAVVLIAVPVPSVVRWHGNRWTLLALGLFAAWCFASISWAVAPGLAWDGANRTLMYALALGVVTLMPWSAGAARIGVAVAVATVAVVAAGVLTSMAVREDPASLFLTGRLAFPTGYSNATANLWLMGSLPAVWFACDRSVRWPLRGLALGAAGLLASTSLLSQSRGSVAAFCLGSVVLVVLAPRRWPVLLALVALLGAVVAQSGPILDVRDVLEEGAGAPGVGAALYDARTAILVTTGALLVLGWLGAGLDRSVSSALAPVARRGDRVILALAVLAVAGGAAATGGPGAWVEDRWDDFKKGGYQQVESAGSRFSGALGSNRYDFYRVGLDQFSSDPLKGVGVDSFGPGYLEKRRSGESPRYAHSLPISTLAETGLVGTLLLLAFFLLAAVRLVRQRAQDAASGATAAGAAGAAVFLGGATVDWLWQFPALGLLGFVLLGIALAARDAPHDADPRRRGSHRQLLRLGGAVAGLLIAFSLAMPGIAARFTDYAYEISATDPRLALERLTKAADYNPIAAGPELARSIILRRLGDLENSGVALDAAVAREPHNWFAFLERAMLNSQRRDWAAAERDMAVAARLNPLQAVVPVVRRTIERRRPVDAERIEATLADQLARKLGQGG